MSQDTPATPPSGATPGTTPQVVTPPSVPNGDQEAKVTIPVEEYRNLQRSDARVKALQRRQALPTAADAAAAALAEGTTDPDVAKTINDLKAGKAEAERKALQLEVRGRVRDLLDKDEYKALPKSTRDLILKNPATLSNATNLEEAMLDIEDFLIEQVAGLAPGTTTTTTTPASPAGHETPVVAPNSASKPDAAGLEDLSKLTGPARSQAAIRNAIKTRAGVAKVQ
jgi:hypothetical protein